MNFRGFELLCDQCYTVGMIIWFNLKIQNRKIMKSIIQLSGLMLLILSLSCQSQTTNSNSLILNNAQDVMKTLEAENIQIVDVRSEDEYKAGHLPNASLISIHDPNFMVKMEALDKNIPVVVYCAVGGRSTTAAQSIVDIGFSKIYNYKGGMRDWMASGMVVSKD
ncbi:MAG: rhodanese-related sulfurtransferase [Cyclobacteriaceae bacterium]|jgi:rhodanese-related sulfurtransferase